MTVSKIWLPRWGIYGCKCMKETLPGVEADMIAAGIIRERLDFYQGAYHKGTAASAGTHDGGGAVDAYPHQGGPANSKGQKIWEKWGAICYYRYPPLFGYHNHVLWRGCPHLAPLARRQVGGAVRSGWNGLSGRSARYGQKAIVPSRTWEQAVKKYEIKPVKPAPKKSEGWFGMAAPKMTERKKPFGLKARREAVLPINDKGDSSLVVGKVDDFYTKITVHVSGLPAGQTIHFRAGHVDYKKGAPARHVIFGGPDAQTVTGLGEDFKVSLTFDGRTGAAPKGWSRRVRIFANASADCTVTYFASWTRT